MAAERAGEGRSDGARDPDARADWRWIDRLSKCVRECPLIETRPSAKALRRHKTLRRPRTVMVGIGICRRRRLSVGLPFDTLGLLLSAEAVRRALYARRLVVVVADTHAVLTGCPPAAAAGYARQVESLIQSIARLAGWDQIETIAAHALHGTGAYRAVLERAEAGCSRHDNAYVRHQVADVAYLNRELGGVIKVGWTLGKSTEADRYRDEVAFDGRYRDVFGDDVPFVYSRAGRTLDPRRLKASPYVASSRERRVLLAADEDPRGKLGAAVQLGAEEAMRGVRNHLKSITRVYSQMVAPLRGPLERRLETLLAQIFPERGEIQRAERAGGPRRTQ